MTPLVLFLRGKIHGTENLHLMAYVLSSFGLLNYQFVRQNSLWSPRLNEDIRAIDSQNNLSITYEFDPDTRRVFNIKQRPSLELSKEALWLLDQIDFMRTMSKNERDQLIFSYLEFSMFEIGDIVPLNKNAVAKLLVFRQKGSI